MVIKHADDDLQNTDRLTRAIVECLEDTKAGDLRVLDVTGLTDVTDRMVIASGTSTRHVRSMADRLQESLREQGTRPLGCEGADEGEWTLLDFGDVVVHLMLPSVREFYDLESLWDQKLVSMLRRQREGGGD
jgi:ribosome-associated protein